MFRAALVSLFMVFMFNLVACSSMKGPDTNTAEGAFALGEKYQKDERFEDALTQFNQVKNKHPYSKLATEAELRIADIHFEREDYIEAQNGYQAFKELHPTHPRIDYVTFRLGLSFFDQLPSTIDRDLQLANRAILYFDEVVSSHPGSEYAVQAKEYKDKAIKMLAEKENYIGHFYFIREFYGSALERYEGILKAYPNQAFIPEVLYGAAVSAYETKEFTKAKEYYDELLSQHSDTNEANKVRSRLGNQL
jgi:outer membrane protein assembly factor BamD